MYDAYVALEEGKPVYLLDSALQGLNALFEARNIAKVINVSATGP